MISYSMNAKPKRKSQNSSTQQDQEQNSNLNWPAPAKELVTKTQWKQIATIFHLTPREREVCELLFEGLTRQSIASKLDIKSRTVRQHLEQIHTKLSVKNRIGVVLRIVQARDRLQKET